MHKNDFNNVVYFYAAALALSFAVTIAVMQLPRMKWLPFSGQNTLVYLAVHVPIIRTLQHVSPAIKGLTDAYPFVAGAVVFLAIIPICLFVNRFLPFLVARKYPPRSPRTA
jgi:fucose 4-O-acetylase-like acetyltransferase